MKLRRALPFMAAFFLLLCAPWGAKANKGDRAREQIQLGNEALRRDDFEGAIAAFQSAAKLQKKPAQARAFLSFAYYRYGSALTKKGELDHAIEVFRQALALGPDEAYWHSGLGTVLEKKGNRQGAMDEFQKACQLSPDDWGLAKKCKQLQSGDQENGHTDSEHGAVVDPAAGSQVKAKKVTVPKELFNPSPSYTEQARLAKYDGTVVLSIVIDKTGIPTEVTVVKALGMGLDQSAIKSVRTWQFKPATRDGVPVPVQVTISVNFTLY